MNTNFKTNPPGGLDVLNARTLLYSDNQWGIPLIQPTKKVPLWLAPYKNRLRSTHPAQLENGAYHFFLPPEHFKCVWERPGEGLRSISRLSTALSPAFPLDGALPQQILATYKNRWCGAWWQRKGIEVIPSILWNGPRSYQFAFAGINRGGVIAVANKNITEHPEGFKVMMEILSPSKVLCFGGPNEVDHSDIIGYPQVFNMRLTR